MPIVRTYACAECNHFLEVTLTMEEWDAPPPPCPACAERRMRRPMQQEFKAPGIINSSPRSKAEALAEDIMENDYHVADYQRNRRPREKPKVRYKDQNPGITASSWQVAQNALEGAIQAGRQSRLAHGSGLDVLQSALKTGAQPDLIEASKRRAIKVW